MREESRRLWMQALEDLKTAEILITNGRYYASVFFSQQAAEKALKSLYIEDRRAPPPRTHNLAEILNELGVAREDLIPNRRRRRSNAGVRGYPVSKRRPGGACNPLQREDGPRALREIEDDNWICRG
ncbi:MAG: HEPN domain-containing protein [Candidatus Bathyarchaeia archaeon]